MDHVRFQGKSEGQAGAMYLDIIRLYRLFLMPGTRQEHQGLRTDGEQKRPSMKPPDTPTLPGLQGRSQKRRCTKMASEVEGVEAKRGENAHLCQVLLRGQVTEG